MLYVKQTWSEQSLMQVQDNDDDLQEVNSDVFFILQKLGVTQSLPYQVSLSLGNYYTLLTAIKGDYLARSRA